jgi:diguanylate cyclase (GGDEF)-like protein
MEIQLREEIERTRKAEERTRKTLMRQDEIAFRLMKTKKELLDKQELLEDAYSKLEEANSKLELLSITDQLTGLFNRRHFDDVFAQEIQRAARYAHPFSVMMMDIDHFKNVNDTYGHQAGDFILKGVANILCSQLRETDILARYGGEEFVVVLPETGESVALSIAERIRGALEEHKFCCGDNELHVTISIGVVTASGEQDDEEVLHAADDALYKAKEEGRNRVVKAEQL